MIMCGEVSEDGYYTVHHEMGHIQYYMSYSKQPAIFQDGANSAFQEAVGDAVMYGAMVPQHLQRLGLISDTTPSPEDDIAFVLRQTLQKIPALPFQLLVDKWRYGVFRGEIKPDDYNTAWWELRERYQGIAPPVVREEDDFDPAAKFHIPDNTPYIRYFLSSVLQVQMFKGMCEASVTGHVGRNVKLPWPLHRCDIYGSREAGKKLKGMLELGRSKPWQDALEILTGKRDYSMKPLLEYHKPAYDWLLRQVWTHDIPVGWE